MIRFITSSQDKFEEMQVFVSDLKMTGMDLPEIQEIDSKRVIEVKLLEARKKVKGEIIVEDTSLLIDGMNGLPGPLIKWFTKALGEEGLYQLQLHLEQLKLLPL